MINEQMIYIGMTVMAVACLFLIYQNYQMRMAHALDISRINKTIKDMENSSRGNNLLPSTNSQPDMVEEFNSTNENNPASDIDNTYNKLKNDGNVELVQTWQGLDAIPDEDETSISVSINSTVAQDLVKTDQEYIKGSWGDIAQWMRLSFNRDDAYDKLHRLIFGWYKGVNIQPTGFNIYLFKFEIDDYLNSSSSDDVDNIEINQFV